MSRPIDPTPSEQPPHADEVRLSNQAANEDVSGEEELRVLDEYLAAVQGGRRDDAKALLKAHTGLRAAFNCLDALESLAPESSPSELEHATLAGFGGADERDSGAGIPKSREFGDFDLLEEIGRGGMGVVYRARERSLDRIVAVKMILASHLASPAQVERFHGEARAAAALEHPRIVGVYQAGCIEGQHYLAMQYVDGASLAEKLQHERTSAEEAARLVADVASAVEHLHQRGLVHRDLKPSNILLDSEGCPFVSDFGLVKMLSEDDGQTSTGMIVGTPSYMSPEQAAAMHDKVGPASDVYSLGAMLYELLTGQPPFREEHPLDTLMQVLERDAPPPSSLGVRVPRELERICMKCLEKSPERRYGSAGELAADLERYLRGETVEAAAPNVVRGLVRWANTKPALAGRLGVLATFYLVELVNFRMGLVPAVFHRQVSAILLVWVIASFVFQQILSFERREWFTTAWAHATRFMWAATDILLFSLVLRIADGVASPLVVGYPLLIVGSGFWFRVRMISFVTTLSIISYVALVLDFYVMRHDLQQRFDRAYDRPFFFVVMLIVLGWSVGYQVNRIRKLTCYYDARREA